MHELSIAMSIVDLVQEEANSRGGFQVEAVHLKLGQLSGVVKEALLFSFELACEQTPLQGSKLVIEEVPVLVNCSTCQAQRAVRSLQCLCCAECGTPAYDVVAGREIFVTALEIRQTENQDLRQEVAQR
jgi:hydrogenase nickel incorporation protein HypA/HybF